MDEQLIVGNRANAEPAMRAAAHRMGALLLPAKAEEFETNPLCGLSGDRCLEEVEVDEADESISHVRDERGKARLAIWVPVELRHYVRLAQGPRGLLLLTPKLSHRLIDEKTYCECDRMPRPVMRTQAAFLVDDVPGLRIDRLTVPMTADWYHWICKAIAV